MKVHVAKENVICIYFNGVFLRHHSGKPGWPAFGYKEGHWTGIQYIYFVYYLHHFMIIIWWIYQIYLKIRWPHFGIFSAYEDCI